MKSLKHILSLALVATILLALGSCKKDPDPELSLSNTSIKVDGGSSNTSIQVTSNTDWVVSSASSWISVTPLSGKNNGSITVVISENTDIDERSGSFYVTTTKGNLSQTVNVTQSGKEITLTVDKTDIHLSSQENSSEYININSNYKWTLSGLPSWLKASSTSGSGISTITLTTREENASSQDRSATLTLTAGGKNCEIFVTQEAGLAQCKTIPSNITSLWYAVIFNLTYSKEVKTTKIYLISDYDYKHMTEKEVIAAVEAEESNIPEDETIYTRWVTGGNKYHILTLSYDSKGNRGELIDEVFTAPEFMSSTDDAWCTITDARYSSTYNYFAFDVTKKGRCDTYNLIYGANIYTGYLSGSLMAFELNYYINNKKRNWLAENWDLKIETDYPNDNSYSCYYSQEYAYGGVIATTRGRFSNGQLSSDITTVSGDTYAEESISQNGKDKTLSEAEWLKQQQGWVKTTKKNVKFNR